MNILGDIRRDLQAFSDPGAPVLIEKDTAVWEQDGKARTARFISSPKGGGLPLVEIDGDRLPYRQFLAGGSMADLHQLAEFILRTTAQPKAFVETEATWKEDEDGTSTGAAATTLIRSRSTEDLPFLTTRVVLVQGEAGSGKTMALRQMAARQAEAYTAKESDFLFFYVDAQGRALSRLEDAMAKDLQDLRSHFSYSAIAPLTRRRLLVPVIDGFDELLGSGGYDEAFSSLAALLSMLDGQGAVIASARSSFFDYRNFYEHAVKFSKDGRLNYELDVVQVESWNEDQIGQYVRLAAEALGRDSEEVERSFSSLYSRLDKGNRALLAKPFYASKVTELALEDR